MTKISFIFFSIILLTSCELIVIGEKAPQRPEVINYDQESAMGTIFLFKTELDSNNVPAASQLLARPDGSTYLAFEQYEMYFEVERVKRLLSSKPVTSFRSDTIAHGKQILDVEFDYLTHFQFTTTKIKNNWYIVNYKHY